MSLYPATGVLLLLLAVATTIASLFAGLELSIGFFRLIDMRDVVDGPTLIHYGAVFAFIAILWGVGALLIALDKWGGGGLALSGSAIAIAHGLFRRSQSPPFGIWGTSAGNPPAGVWATMIPGALILAYVSVSIALDIRRNRPPAGVD